MQNMNSYLVTIDPPKEVANVVDEYRKKYSQYTNYKIPPHIIIRPPFYLKQISEDEVLELLKDGLRNLKSVNLNFNSISYFEGSNNVVFFAPDTNSITSIKEIFIEVINTLHNQTEDVYNDYKLSISEFNPHMTISERIPRDKLEKIKRKLGKSEEKLSFCVEFLHMYKQNENSSLWKEIGKVKLGNNLN